MAGGLTHYCSCDRVGQPNIAVEMTCLAWRFSHYSSCSTIC